MNSLSQNTQNIEDPSQKLHQAVEWQPDQPSNQPIRSKQLKQPLKSTE